MIQNPGVSSIIKPHWNTEYMRTPFLRDDQHLYLDSQGLVDLDRYFPFQVQRLRVDLVIQPALERSSKYFERLLSCTNL